MKNTTADADVILVEPIVQPDYTKARIERAGKLELNPTSYKISGQLLEK